MKRRDSIIEELHTLREGIRRAHDLDVDRIGAMTRQHERKAQRLPADAEPTRRAGRTKTLGQYAVQQRDGAVGAELTPGSLRLIRRIGSPQSHAGCCQP